MNDIKQCELPHGIREVKQNISKIQKLLEYPKLHSKPSCVKKLFLCFQGYFNKTWGSRTNVNTPPFSGTVEQITEIWARVAEDYAPFNIDVTTEPYAEENGKVAIVAIGGSWSDWYGGSAGGVAYVGGFYNLSPGVGYVFANSLGNNAKYIAEAASHEAGHLFGLQHQALWNGTTLVSQYNSGNGNYAPIMGVGYYANKTLWYNGPTAAGPTSLQDDFAVLAGPYNGFGVVPDDYNEAKPTQIIGGIIDISGIINNTVDVDKWTFFTPGGDFNIKIEGSIIGSNLDPILDIVDSSNNVLATGNQINIKLNAGQYWLKAKNNGVTGNIGPYTIKGTVNSYNNITINNGQNLVLNVKGFDKVGNESSLKYKPNWVYNNEIVNLIVSEDGTQCAVITKPGIIGSTLINCQVNDLHDLIQLNIV